VVYFIKEIRNSFSNIAYYISWIKTASLRQIFAIERGRLACSGQATDITIHNQHHTGGFSNAIY